jgi:hypothetical protein
MMRAGGVPARGVAGYQGGEINPVNRTVIVHQFDAHAWAEVWLEGQGWVRVDPTGSVSPDRIEWGLERALAQEGSFLSDSPLSLMRYRGVAWVNMLRLRYDALTYRWQSWVTGFNRDQQFQLLNQMFNGISARKFIAVLIGSWLLVLAPIAFSLLRRKQLRPISEPDRHYLAFCDKLAQAGVVRGAGETPAQYSVRAGRELRSGTQQVEQVTRLYSELVYGRTGAGDNRAQRLLRELRRSVRRFRPGSA